MKSLERQLPGASSWPHRVRPWFGASLAAMAALGMARAQPFDEPLAPFLDTHCADCHDDVAAKGGLDLYSLGNDLSDPAIMERWVRIYDQVSQGVMPPKKKPQPKAAEKSKFLQSLAVSLKAAHEAEKGTVLRRLNRREYQNTLNDLFGTNLDLERDLPEDGKSHGFDNLGETLSLSMVQLQRYMDAMGKVLDASISNEIASPESKIVTARYVDNKGNDKFYKTTWLKRDDGATVFFKASSYPDGLLRGSSIRASGH